MNYSESVLHTDRLYTRSLEMADDQAIFDIFSNPHVTRYWSLPIMTTLLQAQAFIRQTENGFKDDSLLEWGIIKKKDDRLIGTCAYSSWDKNHRRAEIGFALNHEYWGNGYMKELLSIFIPFGFEKLNLHRIEADVDPGNIPSIKLLEHYGFKREGLLRERYHLNTKKHDSIFYGLLKNEFDPQVD